MWSIGVGSPVGSEAFVSLVPENVAIFVDGNRSVEGVRAKIAVEGLGAPPWRRKYIHKLSSGFRLKIRMGVSSAGI